MSIRDDESMQEIHPGHLAGLAIESGSSTSKGSSLVKAIGGKARSLLKTLDHNFGPSITEREDEVASMTIEFLYSRLQAQRAVYKAEKERVQQLVKKVMELEQKLQLEIARRKEAECRDSLVFRRCRSSLRTKDFPCSNERACIMSKEDDAKGISVGSYIFKDDSHRAVEHKCQLTGCCTRMLDTENEIDGGGVHHTDGHDVSSMAQFCLCHQCECHRSNCQELSFQHCSPFNKQFNAPCNKNRMQRGNRENMDWVILNPKKLCHDLDSWNEAHSIDTSDYKETAQNKYASLDFKETPHLSHRFLQLGDSPRKARRFRQHTSSSSMESLEFISVDNLKSLSTRAMSRELVQKCPARAIKNSPGGHNKGDLEGIMNLPNTINSRASTCLFISSPIA